MPLGPLDPGSVVEIRPRYRLISPPPSLDPMDPINGPDPPCEAVRHLLIPATQYMINDPTFSPFPERPEMALPP
jgi:hypothetical protein